VQFYRVDGIAAYELWAEDTENRSATQEMARKINMLSDDFNCKLREKAYFFVTEASEAALTIGVITRDAEKLRDQLGNYLRALGVELKDTKREEITFRNMKRMLSYASRRDYIDDDDGVLAQFGLDRLCSYRGFEFGESVFDRASKGELCEEAECFLARDAFLPELERIYSYSALRPSRRSKRSSR
jgi:hypothetical protein